MNTPNRNRLDEALERLFDREMPPEEQDRLARDLEHEPEALATFRDTTDILLALREPANGPDVTEAVLSRMLPPRRRGVRGRRLLSPARVVVAAVLVLAGAGLAILQQPGRPRTMPPTARSIELDPEVARIFDPQLAERELADLRSDAGLAAPTAAMIHQRATLDAPRLVFELSPVQSLAGAGDAATAYAPFQRVFDDPRADWLARGGSILLPPDEPALIDVPTVFWPAGPEPSPMMIQIQDLDALLRKPQTPPSPDRLMLWPQLLELRLDLPESQRPASTQVDR
ncbi:MAG: hypothetical protein DYG94_10835 [Leptolyngbya sp. PLA3]|nr:MAG: hypothetical protein EDM82_08305 [Cyanobacteria bacterium CYA]MCE7969226.1 hypothetical protein [Leptolyngbya sp. PL-A3]